MSRVEDLTRRGIDRRTFLLGNLAVVTGATAQSSRLETLTQWMQASKSAREAALHACVERIRRVDAEIRAWVQVLPQPSSGSGTLLGIPFGVEVVDPDLLAPGVHRMPAELEHGDLHRVAGPR